MQAFMSTELLDVYRAALAQLQQFLRGNASPPLTSINYFLMEYKVHRMYLRPCFSAD